jgi:hypothetical protein
MMKIQTFKQRFTKQFFTRLYMLLILLGTIISGVIFSKILWFVGLHHMLIRFTIVLILAYLSFFLFMRLWLYYLTSPYRKSRSNKNPTNAEAGVINISDRSSTGSAPDIVGRGGSSGGAGASGSWENMSDSPAMAVSEGATGNAGSVGGSTAGASGDALSGLSDDSAVLIIALLLILLAIFGSGIYLIYQAPDIFSEAAFQIILAAGLIKKTRQISSQGWVGGVFHHTWIPFAITLVVTVISAWVLMIYCPQATKISEVIRLCILNSL